MLKQAHRIYLGRFVPKGQTTHCSLSNGSFVGFPKKHDLNKERGGLRG